MAGSDAETLGERIALARGEKSRARFVMDMPRRPDGEPAMSAQTLSRHEKDETKPDTDQLKAIAEAAERDVNWLLYGEDGGDGGVTPSPPTPGLRQPGDQSELTALAAQLAGLTRKLSELRRQSSRQLGQIEQRLDRLEKRSGR